MLLAGDCTEMEGAATAQVCYLKKMSLGTLHSHGLYATILCIMAMNKKSKSGRRLQRVSVAGKEIMPGAESSLGSPSEEMPDVYFALRSF